MKLFGFCLAFISLAFASVVQAADSAVKQGESVSKELRRCAAIKSDLSRLACFDAYLMKQGVGGKSNRKSTDSGSRWIVQIDTSPLDDSVVSHVATRAVEGKNRRGKPPQLVLRCKGKEQDIYIAWEIFIDSESTSVTARVRSEQAFQATWTVSSDRRSTFYPHSVELIKKLREGGKFVVEVVPFSENPITAVFNVDGLDGTLKGVKNECGW